MSCQLSSEAGEGEASEKVKTPSERAAADHRPEG